MDAVSLIQDLAVVLLAAGLAGAICRRLGLSVIVGYLFAGIVIGPYTPPFSFISDPDRIQTLSQIGLVFLMFGIGLGLSISKLGRMGWPTLLATGVGACLMLFLTQALGAVAGWSSDHTLFVAAMLMVSSSAVIAKVVNELGLSHERFAQLALSITVLEDVVAVVMLTILASRAGQGEANVSGLLAGMTAFVVLLVGAGLLMVPRLLKRLEARANPELQTITVAGVLFLLAICAAKAGYSLALGAFLLGAMVAEIPQKFAVEKAFVGMRDVFSSVFFVSIGMLIDVRLMLHVWPVVIGIAAFALIGRAIATTTALTLSGSRPQEARRAGLLLGPLGEFSFIIAQLGVTASVLPPDYYPIAVGASILTVLLMPVINRYADGIERIANRLEPAWIRRAGEAYHSWFEQLKSSGAPSMSRQFIRSRLVQIAIEAVFVSGVLIFSRRLFEGLLLPRADVIGLQPVTLAYIFWIVIALIVLVPLFAIWRNIATVALIIADTKSPSALLPAGLVERTLKAAGLVLLGGWLYAIAPIDDLGPWGWVVIGVLALVMVTVFSHRLIYWHSHWQTTVRDVLAEDPDAPQRNSVDRLERDNDLASWNVRLGDCVVPDGARYAGSTLADLAIPSRFGCTILEIERNGIVITAIRPDIRFYPGDRLLLLGRPEQISAACDFLTKETHTRDESEEFHGTVLETFSIPATPRTGHTLAELRIAQETGVRIVGIRRGDQTIIAPSGEERLEAGDQVLVAGTLAENRRFHVWLGAAA